jgi:hypothetical protein
VMARALLATLLCSLVPLAHATPPDETWQPGVYDDGDHDALVISEVGLAALAPGAVLFVRRDIPGLIPNDVGARPASTCRFHASRAPPASDALVLDGRCSPGILPRMVADVPARPN